MEKITPGNEYLHLESDVLSKNADALRELVEHSSFTLTEHIRRAAALYQLSLRMYEDGGDVHSVSEAGAEVIPLFDRPAIDSDVRVNLSVKNINKETASLFKDLGINKINFETTVMDNVINHYYQASIRSLNGQKIIAETSQGIKNELLFL
ncbi:MAG TPA: hypothetical protein VIM37_01185 [Candidatus Microsaccharimonas sp.]|jgi:hypothetical protein